jgi:glutamate dehydrogenase
MTPDRARDEGRFSASVSEQLQQLQKRNKSTAKRPSDASAFVAAFFARTAPGDFDLHDTATWAALLADLTEFMRQRAPGVGKVRAFNPDAATNGWNGSNTVVQAVTDDSPFLVDSVNMAIANAGLQMHAVIHPVLAAARDADGHLLALDAAAGAPESIMHFEIDRVADADELARLQKAIEAALGDVRAAIEDWPAMREKTLAVAADLPHRRLPVDAAGIAEAQAFLEWVADDNFTFLGYREYEVAAVGGDEVLRAIGSSGLGILRGSERSVAPRSLRSLAATELPQSGAVDAIILTKTNARSDVHRPGYMDYIGVLKFDAAGKPVAEQRFLGLYTSSAYMRRPQDVPLVRQKYEAVMARSGLRRDSYSGKALRHILETLPRDELFQCSADELYAVATGILDLKERARPRLFVRRDKYGRFFSCLAFIPRERFNTGVRERVEAMLREAFRGEHLDSTVLMGESALARLHVTVRPQPGDRPEFDPAQLEARLVEHVRNWYDDLRESLVHDLGEQGAALASRYGKALPAGYIEEVTPEVAAADVQMLAALEGDDAVRMSFYRPAQRPDELRFKVYRRGGDIALSEVLPQLENLGLRVLTEHVYEMDVAGTRFFIQDFEVRPADELTFAVEDVGGHFERAFEQVWRGNAESDGFNRLVLGALLDWRQVALLRGYCKYLQQVGIAFSQSYMEETLNRYPGIANLLVELFNAKFDPRRETPSADELARAGKQLRRELEALVPAATREAQPGFIDDAVAVLARPRDEQVHAYWEAIKVLLDGVASLDDERILKSYMDVIRATLRTSYFQLWDGAPRHYISLKFDSHMVPDAPKPVPYREIFVYAPRVEGVHLRFGPVARGGLRWSDRREDFRTEVLGLVKAQMVKNTVIVPVGSKGGFFVKRSPAGGDRDAVQAEGIACYRLFIEGLLDITDNLVDGKTVPPVDVVRHDDDDPYLVVAADKGTATFSDIANGIAQAHGYWLDDAFASGGSVGYDHKGMGITAKGAWESVKRHFRALGHDCQAQDFTCVGIGDMSGDVFGNGMLLSRHIRLVAAFDHRHIFLDPDPDAASSFKERERMFKLPRSSWADYDAKLISKGGGVFPRDAKSIVLSPEIKAALGIDADVAAMSPVELLSAILKAPVDLLWNGGIGTYVKSSRETNMDVGDRANNALRVDGRDLRCKVVGEGGNLGMTQLGRIEAAQHGVLLNTDFIDNSAGVDTSDHEVNIKILLNGEVRKKKLKFEDRNTLLASMTDEVGALVLTDNYRQNQAISLMERMSLTRLGSKLHFIRTLESQGLLDRQIEYLPSDAEIAERKARGQGLTRPELAVLLSYSKLVAFQQLLESDVPEDPYLSKELVRYFPEPLQKKYAKAMEQHRLKREIIATAVTNSTINRMGATFLLRMQEDSGRTPGEVAKAFTITRETLDARELWAQIDALDGKVAESAQIDALQVIWQLQRSFTRWLLSRPGAIPDITTAVERYHDGFKDIRAGENILPASMRPRYEASLRDWKHKGMPTELGGQLAALPYLEPCCDIIEVARERKLRPIEVAKVHFRLGDALNVPWLHEQIDALAVEGRWHAVARGVLRDELATQQRVLVTQVLAMPGATADAKVRHWLERDDPSLRFTLSMLNELAAQKTMDYPTASVAVQRLSQLASRG